MIVLNFFRVLSDLGFYYTFAGTISHVFGGKLTFMGLLLQSACFALSAGLQKRRWARLLALVPMLLFFWFAETVADDIAYIPAMLYVCYLAFTGDYSLDWGRQAGIFDLYWKAALSIGIFLSLVGCWRSVAAVGVPVALLTVTVSILLLRTLRHDPEVYLQKPYQVINVVSMLAVFLAVWLVGNRWVLYGVLFLLKSVYNYMIVPLILGLAAVVGFVLVAIWPESGSTAYLTDMMDAMQGADSLAEEVEESAAGTFAFPWQFFAVLATLAAVIVLFLFFRWLARQRTYRGENTSEFMVRTSTISPDRRKGNVQTTKYVSRIRGHYRSFLRYCRKNGVTIQRSDTSTDICAKADIPDREALEEFRQIYQKARYHGEATRTDAARSKALLNRIKA